MSYGLIDDALWRNRKTRGFTDAEHRLWVNAISWCRENRDTRGVMTLADLALVGAGYGLRSGRRLKALIDGLLTKRGLDADPGGYLVHDYRAIYERKSEAGKKAAGARWHGDATGHAIDHAIDHAIGIAPTRAGTPSPTPSPPPTPLSLSFSKTETDIAAEVARRGVDPDSIPSRLADLKQELTDKGIRNWVRYATSSPETGKTCLLERTIDRWLEEDHERRKHEPIPLRAILQREGLA